MSDQPPPPPPHGTNFRRSSPNLPPGKYDIFIIPPHSSGAGFLYLPSLKPNVNSFAAGFATALVAVVLFQSMAPAFRVWYNNFQGMGNTGMLILVIAVGVGAWALGRIQNERGPSSGNGGDSRHSWSYNPGDNGHSGGPHSNAGPPPHSRAPDPDGPPPPPPPHGTPPRSGPSPNNAGTEKPKSSWQERPHQRPRERSQDRPQRAQEKPQERPRPENTKGSWERAREETRRKEEERKAKEAEQRKKEEIARRIKELREKEARERAKREHEAKERREKEEQQEVKEREAREREAREREAKEREAKEQEAKEREAKEREAARLKEVEAAKEADTTRRGTYAFSSVGERTNPWPNGKPPTQAPSPTKPAATPSVAPTATPSGTSNSTRRPPPPTAQSFRGTDDDAYSYRTYSQPKAHTRRKSGETVFTESSYAPSQSTSRTTPPPSVRGPYTTKDPDKIVIKAVYGFLNQFSKTPASQLLSGVGHVTDGLILRITTEGLFIDDDVRGVPQREWDVKAWTLKLMEVWCPAHTTTDANASPRVANKTAPPRFKFSARGQQKALMGDDADGYLTELLHACKDDCRLGTASSRGTSQTGDWKQRGLHVLRATIRDQEGKRFLFVLGEEEGWKVAVGLQRLRKGTQVRQLGIQPMPLNEARGAVETLGW
ncbi:hypothetical protein F5X98DRAFT_362088 [Xylaria grammica]|nr:hypothetical protein F5X98DRAFT_362088 [Xylaria grammica]